MSSKVEQRKIKIFPFQKKETIKPTQLNLKLQLKASEQFPAAMVHPTGLKYSLTSSRLRIRQDIGICGGGGAGDKTHYYGSLQFYFFGCFGTGSSWF